MAFAPPEEESIHGGRQLVDNMSLGFSALAWYMRADEDAPSYLFEDGLGFGAEAGYIYSSPNSPLVLAFSAAYAYQAA